MNIYEVSGIDLINLITASGGLILALMCLLMSVRAQLMESWGRRFFIYFFSIQTLNIAFDLASILNTDYMHGGSPAVSQLFLFLNSLFSSMLMPMIMLLMLHLTGESIRRSRVLYAVMSVWAVYVVLLLITQFTTFIYYFDSNNVYHRGPYYPLLLVPPAVTMVIIFIALLRRRSRLTERQFRSFLIYILLPLACMLIQMRFYGIYIVALGTCVGSFVMFYNVYNEYMVIAMRQQEENAKLLADNRLLQMRPHFIYNTLMSIYYLSGDDGEKARRVILDFSIYLRKNFTALAGTDTIPFEEELEHARAYLAVETARFEDLLSVEFDTPYTGFRLPPLTMQPLVENSVKHGLDPEADPLHIIVRSRETDTESLVTVEDNGTGFAEAASSDVPASAPDGGTHIALDNIRERLEHVCGGSLDIAAREGGGTVVTIRIPK